MEENFIISTLENVPNMDIEQHLGLVSGSAIIKSYAANSFLSLFKNFFGGIDDRTDDTFSKARQMALDEMKNEAIKLGANVVINVRFESLRQSHGCEVHVYGSAVKGNSF